MAAREWTQEQDALVRQLYDDGLTTTQMGLQLDIPRTTVQERIYALQLHARPAARPRGSWAPEKDARLTELWADKALTATDIGKRMGGLTKNAIIGRSHRLKLPARQSPIKVVGETQRYLRSFKARAPKRESASQQPLSGPTLPQLESARVPVLAYPIARVREPMPTRALVGRVTVCAYPHGEPRTPSFHFCDAPTLPGGPYCGEHHRLCYVCVRQYEDAA